MAKRITPSAGKKPDKLMRDAIALELHQEIDVPAELAKQLRAKKIKKLRLVAIALVNAAIKGDMAAIREIDDRMDGKSVQPIRGDSEDGTIDLKVRFIVESAPA